jgi:hypothetical protein
MMPAIWLHAYKRPDFIEDCATTDQITAIRRKLFRQIGIWMLLATSPICDRRLILP